MGQATLLVLDRTDVTCVRTKETLLEIRNKDLELPVKHTGDQFWPVSRLLAREQVTDDLGPPRVSCKGNKEGRLPKKADGRHRVLKALLHITITTRKSRREHDTAADISRINICTAAQRRVSASPLYKSARIFFWFDRSHWRDVASQAAKASTIYC